MPGLCEQKPNVGSGAYLTPPPTFIDRLDARPRILVALLFAATVVFCTSFAALSIALLLAFGFALLAKLNLRHTLKRLMAMDLFLVILLLMLPFTVPGTPLFWIGDAAASLEGVVKAGEIALKANAVVLALLALVGTLESTTLGHALARLKVPAKLVQLLMFTVRYLEVVNREYCRMRNAMRARAFVLRGNMHSWRSIGFLLGMLLIRSLERADRIMDAMKCRGYTGHFYLLDNMQINRIDRLFFTTNLVLLTALLGINQL